MAKILKPHHRRPRSLGGSNSSYNKSWVEEDLHNAWHVIFGNMNAYQIANHINSFGVPYKPENVYVFSRFINGEEVLKCGSSNKNISKKDSKIRSSWHKLFKNMNFEYTVYFINNVWLDPSYHLYVRKLF